MPYFEPFEARSADHLRLMLEVSQIGIWDLDVASGRAVRNKTHDSIFGYDEKLDSWSYERFLDHIVESDRPRVDRLQSAAIEEGKEWAFECQIVTAKGERRWIRAAGRPLHAEDGEIIRLIGHVIDITDSKQDEARLRLVTDELNHRVRNMLTVIKSMISMTARRASDVDQLAKALEGRVGALARTQNLLVNRDSNSMLPSEIVKAELAALTDRESRVQLSVAGEHKLTASAGQGLALVIHELLTNAIKYGALSSDSGKLDLSIEEADGKVRIDWVESGGPVPQKHPEQGFGAVLILSALGREGSVEQEYSAQGLTCRILVETER